MPEDDIPVTPEEEEAWQAMPATALVRPIEAGCLAKVVGSGPNTGRIVRVMYPMQTGDTYGPDNRVFKSSSDHPHLTRWLVAPIDGGTLEVMGQRKPVRVLVSRFLERIDETD